jgi:predicted secreted protein
MYRTEQKRKWLLNAVFSVSLAALMVPVLGASVYAGDTSDANARHHDSGKWPQASLNAEASAVIAQDTVIITLAAELSDPSQAKINSSLTKVLDSVMQEAKAAAKDNAKIKVSSGNYRLWPFHDKNGKISNWQGRGEILIESSDFSAASDLAGKLADRMPISNLNFSVSPQARARQEQALLTQAAKAFRDRAQALTDAFGFASYTVRNIDLGGSGAQYQPAPRMMSMAADKAVGAPLEAGTEQVTLSVRGAIFLHSAQK